MRPRTIIFIAAGVLFINGLTILAVWAWSRAKSSRISSPNVQPQTGLAETEQTPTDSRSENPSTEKTIAPISAPEISATWAEIDSPRDGEAVPRRFWVTGRCGPVPTGSQLMLVVDSGRGVFSPKLPPLVVDKETWSGTGNEFGAPSGGTFSLCVFAVSDEAVSKISEWHEQGKATGKWPPFRNSVPGGVPLAKIKLRVANK